MERKNQLLNLYKILSEEYRLYKYAFVIAQDKKKIIIDGKVNELEEMIKKEKVFVLKINKIEEVRERLVSEIANDLRINADIINMKLILSNLEEEDITKQLKEIQIKIVDIVKKIKDINEINSKLIKNSLEYIDFSINILSSNDDFDNNYGNKGKINTAKKRIYFDKKL